MKPFIRHNKTDSILDIAPLIDVMFMLLLFFILTSSFMNPSIKLNLPSASNKEKLKVHDLVISADKESRIYINRREVSIDKLETVLKGQILNKSSKRIIFKADENLLYKKFVQIMDIIKRSGVKEINIAHDNTESN